MNNQPPVPPQPSAPQAPVTPQQPYAPMPSKRPKTGLIIGLVAAGVLVVAGVVVLLVFLLSGVSKADYKEAQQAAQDTASEYSSIASDLKSLARSATTDGGIKDVDGTRESLDAYKKNVADLKDQKAFKDKEAKKLYDEFVVKSDKTVAFVESFIGEADTLNAIAKDCSASKASAVYGISDTSQLKATYDKVLGPCMDSLAELAKSSNEALAGYSKKVLDLYKEQQSLIGDLQAAIDAKDRTAYTRISSQISSQARKFSSTDTSGITKELDDVNASDELNALGRYLTDKANGR